MLARLEKYGALNTHDLVKVVALLIMTIDHIGAFLFPEQLWWRAIGRITFPVWFFLVGYARGSRIGQELIWFALLMLLVQAATYYPMFPLNALVSIMACRLALRLDERWRVAERYPLELLVACFLLHLPFFVLWEYGGVALMLAFAGRMARQGYRSLKHKLFWVGAVCSFLLWQKIDFPEFSDVQFGFVVVGTALVCLGLYHYRQMPLGWTLVKPVDVGLKLLSRYSLQYYVLHRAILQLIAAYVLGLHAHVFRLV